jgi:hypothetical protein
MDSLLMVEQRLSHPDGSYDLQRAYFCELIRVWRPN